MLKDDILFLSSLYGVTGHEAKVAQAVSDMLRPLVDEVHVDRMRNVIGRKACGKAGAPKLVLSAHMDQVGLVVTHITDEGFACVASLGVDDRVMLGAKLLILTDSGPVRCFTAAVPPHLQNLGDETKKVEINKVYLDLGMSGNEARKIVRPGDVAVYDVQPSMLLNDRITGAALDDRVGISCILEALRRMDDTTQACDVVVLFSTMEESNHQGCLSAIREIRPDYMIAVDACHGTTLHCQAYDRVHHLGCGAVIAMGPNSSPAFARQLMKIADENKIAYDREAIPKESFTDAWVAQTANEGIYTAVLSFPIRHMHTPVEVLDIRDAESVTALLAVVCSTFGGLNSDE